MSVRVGTSGWSYPGGRGTWNGTFYPAKGARPRGFDELEFYARWFDVVEVNSTFYGQPRAPVTAKWADRTPAGFEFAIKLFQKFTHPAMFREAVAAHAPGAAPAALELAGVVRQTDVDEFKTGVEPLAAAGKLGALLVQFPPSFTATPEGVDYLGWLLRTFAAYPLAVELRHKSVERPGSGHDGTAQRVWRGLGAHRRAEVPLLDPAELAGAGRAGRRGAGLPAVPRPQRRRVVAPRRGRRPLQLPVLGAGTHAARRRGRRPDGAA